MSVLEELKARVIAGDTKVKPSDLANARAADELAELQVLAAERQARHVEAQAHADRVAEFMTAYEEFMATDIEPIRTEYANLVVSVAALRALLEEYREKQTDIIRRARRLGLSGRVSLGGSAKFHPPVPEDRERWIAQYVDHDTPAQTGMPEQSYIAYAVQEGKQGYPGDGGVVTHALHTDERREELRSLTSADQHRRGVEMRDRILNEALSATE